MMKDHMIISDSHFSRINQEISGNQEDPASEDLKND